MSPQKHNARKKPLRTEYKAFQLFFKIKVICHSIIPDDLPFFSELFSELEAIPKNSTFLRTYQNSETLNSFT